MSAEFSLHRGRGWLTFAMTAAFGVICLVTTLHAPVYWIVLGTALGLGCLAAAIWIARWLLHSGPILVISAEGLSYAPFADRAVPWNEITAMTRTLGYGRTQFLNKVTWARAPRSDQLNFDVVDMRAYPGGLMRAVSRWAARAGGLPQISLALGMFDAEPDTIVAEIKKYWTGAIAEFDPRPVGQR